MIGFTRFTLCILYIVEDLYTDCKRFTYGLPRIGADLKRIVEDSTKNGIQIFVI